MKCNDSECVVCNNLDLNLIKEIYLPTIDIAASEYFRANIIDPNNILNSKEQIIYVLNHSGMTFPYDIAIFDVLLLKHHLNNSKNKAETIQNKARILVDYQLDNNPLTEMFFVKNSYYKLGSINADIKNFLKILSHGLNTIITPEGVDGNGKGWNRRYKLQKYNSAFIYFALKYNLKIVLVSVINGENLTPFTYRSKIINKIGWIIFRTKWIPVGPLTLIKLLFPPFVFYALPANLKYIIHDPVDLSKIPYSGLQKIDFLADEIQKQHQKYINEALKVYTKPYDFFGFVKSFIKSKHKFYFFFPLWVLIAHLKLKTPIYKIILYYIPIIGHLFIIYDNRKK